MAQKKKGANTGLMVAEAAAATAAVAAAGYYFYASKRAKQHRRTAAKWATALKNEVVRDAKKLQKIDAESIARVVDTAARTYRDGVSPEDLKALGRELKANWKNIKSEATGRPAAKKAKKATKKSTRRRTSKKAA